MAKRIADLCVATGKYTDSQNKEKTQFENIGVEMENDDGSRFILLKPWVSLSGFEHEGKMIMVSLFNANSSPETGKASTQSAVTTEGGYPATKSEEVNSKKELDLF